MSPKKTKKPKQANRDTNLVGSATHRTSSGALAPFPHTDCCEGCKDDRLCCKCGTSSSAMTGRCTSVRCGECCTGYGKAKDGCGHGPAPR